MNPHIQALSMEPYRYAVAQPGDTVPRSQIDGSVLSRRNHLREVAVFERMVLDVHREVPKGVPLRKGSGTSRCTSMTIRSNTATSRE